MCRLCAIFDVMVWYNLFLCSIFFCCSTTHVVSVKLIVVTGVGVDVLSRRWLMSLCAKVVQPSLVLGDEG